MPVTYIWATPQKLACFLAASWNQPGFGSHQQTSQTKHQAHIYTSQIIHQAHIYTSQIIHQAHIYIHHRLHIKNESYIHKYTSRIKVKSFRFMTASLKLQVTSSKFTVSEHLEWTHAACAGSSWKLPFGSMISLRMKSQSIRWTILSAPWSTSWVAL